MKVIQRGTSKSGPLAIVADRDVHNEKLFAFEAGEHGEDETIELFQWLINSGLAWTLHGCYGRTARDLIQAGLCHGRTT